MTEEQEQPVFLDALFRQKRKHGKFRLVEAPRLEGEVASLNVAQAATAVMYEWLRQNR